MSDGSGGASISRIQYSLATIEAAGATAGSVFGEMPDRGWYDALLARDITPFVAMVDAVVAAALQDPPDCLVSDAVDGHNPLHDLCQALAAAAASRLAARDAPIRHLVAPATAAALGTPAATLLLDDAAARRKVAAVAAYAPLAEEARRILSEEPSALQTECLLAPSFAWPLHWLPEWEAIGRGRVASGRFATPITYANHVRPIALALCVAAGFSHPGSAAIVHPNEDLRDQE